MDKIVIEIFLALFGNSCSKITLKQKKSQRFTSWKTE